MCWGVDLQVNQERGNIVFERNLTGQMESHMIAEPNRREPGTRPRDKARASTLTRAAVSIVIVVSSLVIAYAVVLEDRGSPEWVLSEFVDALNAGDADAAAGLTIVSLMSESRLASEALSIAEELRLLGEYRYLFRNVVTLDPVNGSGVSRHDLFLAGEAMRLLESDYGVEFENSYDEMAFVGAEMYLRSSEVEETSWYTVWVFLRPGTQWYIVL